MFLNPSNIPMCCMCTLTGAYSARLKWSEPEQPNGLISHYRLVYKKHQQDPTLNSTAVTALTVEVNAHVHMDTYTCTVDDGNMDTFIYTFSFTVWPELLTHAKTCEHKLKNVQTCL